MLKPLIIILLFISSCTSLSEAEKRREALNGNWIIISPEHDLADGSQYRAYSHIQDSIIGLMGLKLIKLSGNGTFQQIDSFNKSGRWGMTPDNIVFIENGGLGFDNFSATFSDYRDQMLHLTQFVEAEGEKIKLTWSLKKVTGKYASKLFDENNNSWRVKPGTPESEGQINQRLSTMLQYYSNYYKLVTRECDFFISRRVILPFTFYRHAMAMKPLEEAVYFASLFYNKEQADLAWKQLKRVLVRLRDNYPSGDDFLEEYAEFMKKMADEMMKI